MVPEPMLRYIEYEEDEIVKDMFVNLEKHIEMFEKIHEYKVMFQDIFQENIYESKIENVKQLAICT